jgi:uncharacterized protein YecT (DUF1311 family)
MLKFLTVLLTLLCSVAQANIELPFYEDDAEFEHCEKISGDRDYCIKEENKRVLNRVKNGYRGLFVNSKLNAANQNPEANRKMLRDMYDSWTAFRNRYCSLSKVAAQYMATIQDEELTCNLYQTFLHEEYLNDILFALDGKPLPSNSAFLLIDEHDRKYNNCIKEKKDSDTCLSQETDRTSQNVKTSYQYVLENSELHDWNNSDSLQYGNLRDMFDSWIAYRNRFCAITVEAYKLGAKKSLPLDQCILFFNLQMQQMMTDVMAASGSMLDEEIENNESIAAAEGEKIKPLQYRSATNVSKRDTLTEEDADNQAENQTEESDNSSAKLPAWAKKR